MAWNRGRTAQYVEPTALVDLTISWLKLTPAELSAIERQRKRYEEIGAPAGSTAVIGEFPAKPWDFVALDVETANNDRSSICQVGLAFVLGGKIASVSSIYVDPETNDWSCTRVHGITAAKVRGAPTFADVLSSLDRAPTGELLFQHSGFDSSAVRAACVKANLPVPQWQWHDSLDVAKRA